MIVSEDSKTAIVVVTDLSNERTEGEDSAILISDTSRFQGSMFAIIVACVSLLL